mmetsp:Transcript_18371/g.32527  ORF Transcript_18371/g.32527 Transcript_18371/m.32527 type:complete len:373 (+) Transcript_18371:340-1458(+)
MSLAQALLLLVQLLMVVDALAVCPVRGSIVLVVGPCKHVVDAGQVIVVVNVVGGAVVADVVVVVVVVGGRGVVVLSKGVEASRRKLWCGRRCHVAISAEQAALGLKPCLEGVLVVCPGGVVLQSLLGFEGLWAHRALESVDAVVHSFDVARHDLLSEKALAADGAREVAKALFTMRACVHVGKGLELPPGPWAADLEAALCVGVVLETVASLERLSAPVALKVLDPCVHAGDVSNKRVLPSKVAVAQGALEAAFDVSHELADPVLELRPNDFLFDALSVGNRWLCDLRNQGLKGLLLLLPCGLVGGRVLRWDVAVGNVSIEVPLLFPRVNDRLVQSIGASLASSQSCLLQLLLHFQPLFLLVQQARVQQANV